MRVKSRVESVTKRVAEAFTPAPGSETDVLDTLKAEHEEVEDLLNQLEKADAAGQRKSLVQKIKVALVPHTKAEQKVVYDAVLGIRDKEVQEDGHEGYWEHELASKTLEKLSALEGANSPEHKAVGKVLKELVTHHVQEEERNIWAHVKKHFSKEERFALNRAYERAKAKVRVN
ncbi:MAG TPA: hemerythrin domain-containing protein [Steroidobacteraceae bacterium]|nr:hemerythrin domain-containing protein [Steroidobacteraceae bacterium]